MSTKPETYCGSLGPTMSILQLVMTPDAELVNFVIDKYHRVRRENLWPKYWHCRNPDCVTCCNTASLVARLEHDSAYRRLYMSRLAAEPAPACDPLDVIWEELPPWWYRVNDATK